MEELIKGIREKAEKMRCEVGELIGDMEEEFKSLKETIRKKIVK